MYTERLHQKTVKVQHQQQSTTQCQFLTNNNTNQTCRIKHQTEINIPCQKVITAGINSQMQQEIIGLKFDYDRMSNFNGLLMSKMNSLQYQIIQLKDYLKKTTLKSVDNSKQEQQYHKLLQQQSKNYKQIQQYSRFYNQYKQNQQMSNKNIYSFKNTHNNQQFRGNTANIDHEGSIPLLHSKFNSNNKQYTHRQSYDRNAQQQISKDSIEHDKYQSYNYKIRKRDKQASKIKGSNKKQAYITTAQNEYSNSKDIGIQFRDQGIVSNRQAHSKQQNHKIIKNDTKMQKKEQYRFKRLKSEGDNYHTKNAYKNMNRGAIDAYQQDISDCTQQPHRQYYYETCNCNSSSEDQLLCNYAIQQHHNYRHIRATPQRNINYHHLLEQERQNRRKMSYFKQKHQINQKQPKQNNYLPQNSNYIPQNNNNNRYKKNSYLKKYTQPQPQLSHQQTIEDYIRYLKHQNCNLKHHINHR